MESTSFFFVAQVNQWRMVALPETNIAPENGCLEDDFPFGKAYFQILSFCIKLLEMTSKEVFGRKLRSSHPVALHHMTTETQGLFHFAPENLGWPKKRREGGESFTVLLSKFV